MRNKIAIVTGASGGIGRSVANQLIMDNFYVHGIDVCPQPMIFNHLSYAHHIIDMRDFISLSQTIESIITPTSDHSLVNCAGLREICSINDLTLSLWEEIFAVNVTAIFVASKAFCRRLIEYDQAGSIVSISSVSGLLGEPNRTAYVASKHAVIGLTKQLAIEYGKFNIRANAIAPGVIRTPLTETYFSNPAQLNKINAGQFIEHCGQPIDIANAVSFLVSEQSRFMTESTLVIDGGWSAGKII